MLIRRNTPFTNEFTRNIALVKNMFSCSVSSNMLFINMTHSLYKKLYLKQSIINYDFFILLYMMSSIMIHSFSLLFEPRLSINL